MGQDLEAEPSEKLHTKFAADVGRVLAAHSSDINSEFWEWGHIFNFVNILLLNVNKAEATIGKYMCQRRGIF